MYNTEYTHFLKGIVNKFLKCAVNRNTNKQLIFTSLIFNFDPIIIWLLTDAYFFVEAFEDLRLIVRLLILFIDRLLYMAHNI